MPRRPPRHAPLAAPVAALLLAACSGAAPAPAGAQPGIRSTPGAAVASSPAATPALPAYAIDSLRARSYTGGRIALGDRTGGTTLFSTRRVTWPSQGGTMTGLADIPAGVGPFPVAVVNHGYIPAARYRPGQDSSKYADAFAAAGVLTVSPDDPGYAGSGPPEADLVAIEAEAVADMDLIGALPSLPAADPRRVTMVGHSNAGGPPVLVMQGTADEDIPAEWTAATVAALQARGVRTRFVSVPGAHHNLAGADLVQANALGAEWMRGAG